jgi:hypothetical protein
MEDNLYAVFSKPPADLPFDEFEAWYEQHAHENIQTPHFVSVQRYRVSPTVIASGVGPRKTDVDPSAVIYRYLAAYRFRGDIADVRADLASRVEGGDIVLPPWFSQVAFSSWSCEPVGGPITRGATS